MTRETRIAMLVGLLFIVMFGLVVSELTGGGASSAAIRGRGETAINQRYAPSLQVEPPPAGDGPAAPETARGESSGASLELAHHAPDACSFVDVRVSPRTHPEPTEAETSRSSTLTRREVERIEDVTPPPPPPPPPPPAGKKYIVKAKDTLIKIARAEYGPDNERQYVLIQQANKEGLRGGTTLTVGQELVIPPLPPSLASSRTPAPAVAPPAPPPTPSYRVMDSEELRRLFGPVPAPSGPVPAPGPTPGPTVARTPETPKQFYVTRRGDSLGRIAREKMKDDSQASIRRLYNANRDRLRDPDNLPVGVKLEIPA